MRQDGKRPAASVPFAKKPLDADPALAGKFISLVGAVFDNVILVVAPMTGNGSGLIFLGNFIQILYDVEQLVGHGYSPFFICENKMCTGSIAHAPPFIPPQRGERIQGMGGSCCLNRSVSIDEFFDWAGLGRDGLADHTTCRFSRRDTCGYSS